MQIAVLIVFVNEEYLHVGEVVVAKMSGEAEEVRRGGARGGGEVVWLSGLRQLAVRNLGWLHSGDGFTCAFHDVEEE